MLIGIVGKPSSGKTTFFNAATMGEAKVGDYPFTTIEPNRGVTWIRVPCPCKEFGVKCSPRKGFCVDGNRFVPVEIIDVAGLVPGAHQGRGLGNQFLDDLRQADVLLHVVDLSGSTDAEGKKVPAGTFDPEEEILFLREEIIRWIEGILNRAGRNPEKRKKAVSGLGVPEETDIDFSEDPYEIARKIQERYKPILVVGNKIDYEEAKKNLKRLERKYKIIPTSALAEYVLRKAWKAGKIRYIPGDPDFEILAPLTPEQQAGLEYIREKVLKPVGNTGVQQAINEAVLNLLGCSVVYPVENKERLSDSAGNVLPDAFIMPKGATVLDVARKIHSEIAEGFVAAIDVRTGKRLGKNSPVTNGLIVKILFR